MDYGQFMGWRKLDDQIATTHRAARFRDKVFQKVEASW